MATLSVFEIVYDDAAFAAVHESAVGHETVMASQSPHVCCLGQRGRHPLGMSISHFDPQQTFVSRDG
jgi:hypothetical protein